MMVRSWCSHSAGIRNPTSSSCHVMAPRVPSPSRRKCEVCASKCEFSGPLNAHNDAHISHLAEVVREGDENCLVCWLAEGEGGGAGFLGEGVELDGDVDAPRATEGDIECQSLKVIRAGPNHGRVQVVNAG